MRYAIFCNQCRSWVCLGDLLKNSDINVPSMLRNTIPVFPKKAYAQSAMNRAQKNCIFHSSSLQIIAMESE